MSVTNFIITRAISTSCARYGKRNFRKFEIKNKRGSKLFKQMQAESQYENPDPRYPIDSKLNHYLFLIAFYHLLINLLFSERGVRDIGFHDGKKFIEVPEMIPELIVPNLEGFTLKPYVTYKSEDVYQEEFTAKNLFDAVYAPKIAEDFKNGKLNSSGEALNPSAEESLTVKEARDNASKPCSDMFTAPPLPPGTVFPTEPR